MVCTAPVTHARFQFCLTTRNTTVLHAHRVHFTQTYTQRVVRSNLCSFLMIQRNDVPNLYRLPTDLREQHRVSTGETWDFLLRPVDRCLKLIIDCEFAPSMPECDILSATVGERGGGNERLLDFPPWPVWALSGDVGGGHWKVPNWLRGDNACCQKGRNSGQEVVRYKWSRCWAAYDTPTFGHAVLILLHCRAVCYPRNVPESKNRIKLRASVPELNLERVGPCKGSYHTVSVFSMPPSLAEKGGVTFVYCPFGSVGIPMYSSR